MRATDDKPNDVMPSGAVAGAVLRAARVSARLSTQRFAALLLVAPAAAKGWEQGVQPLATVPGDCMDRIVAVLRDASADEAIVADLHVAAWCDMTIDCVTREPDSHLTAAILTDELAWADNFRELLAWALTGTTPASYSRYSTDGPLISAADAALFASGARFLAMVTDDLETRDSALALATMADA
jgi:hypothetical protein